LKQHQYTPEVAIALLSYNSLPLLKKYIPLVLETTQHLNGAELVVINNASTDDTQAWLKETYPNLRTVEIVKNHGFTGGYTEGLAQIEAKNYVLLSSDIEVTPGWLDHGLALLNSDPKIAAVQPKVMSYDKRDEFEYAGAAGGYIDHLGYPFCRGRLVNATEKDEGQFNDSRQIFWASGACLFIKADVYHKSGGLDNDFFAHMEEIDLAWRLQNMGYKIMYEPKSVIYHMGGFVIQYGSPPKIYRNHRNNLIMLTKNLPIGELIWKLPVRILLDYLAFVKMLGDGNPKASFAVMQAHFGFFFSFGKWWRKRKATQKQFIQFGTFGILPKSLVWHFFALKKRKFEELNWDPVDVKKP